MPGGKPRTFGAFLRRDRERRGLTQRELAKAIGVSSGTVIGNIEQGLNSPRMRTVAALASFFEWDLNRVASNYFGATSRLESMEGIASELNARPKLLELVGVVRELEDDRLVMVTDVARAWKSTNGNGNTH